MHSEWREVSLFNVARVRNGAGIKAKHFAKTGVPLARVSDFTDDSIELDTCRFVEPQHAREWQDHCLGRGDTVVATVGSWPPNWSSVVGKVVRVPVSAEGAIQNQNTACVIPEPHELDKRYLYYRLRSRDFLLHVANAAGGSANQARIAIKNLVKFRFNLPPFHEQRRIAAVLGALDDKIELNRKMNRTLEEMAQALFKSWFIDFDGHDDLVESELGPIPRGWEVGTLLDYLTLQRGFDLPKKKRRPGPYPVFAAGGLHGSHDEFKVDAPGVITGRSGKLGDVYLAETPFWPLNTTLWVKKYGRSRPHHAYQLLQTLDLACFNAGSAVPSLNRNHVHNLPLPLPPLSLVEKYEETVRPVFQRRNANREESSTPQSSRSCLER